MPTPEMAAMLADVRLLDRLCMSGFDDTDPRLVEVVERIDEASRQMTDAEVAEVQRYAAELETFDPGTN